MKNKQTDYKSDGGQSLKKKKKRDYANLTDEEIDKIAKKRADKKMNKALESFGTDKYVPGAMPDEYYANKDKARERLKKKKKKAGTGNHPLNK